MHLTEKHIAVIREFLDTNEQTASWIKHFSTGNTNSERVAASIFFKRPEVKKMLKVMRDTRDKAILQATQKTYEKLFSEEIASDLELDIFHTSVIRGKVEVEEIFEVKEKRLVPFTDAATGHRKTIVEDTTVFKRVKRLPNISERQASAKELYKRRGSYKMVPRAQDGDQDDTEQAEMSKGNEVTAIRRTIMLSDGKLLEMPQ